MIDVIEDVDPKQHAIRQDLETLVQGLWREMLEAYMLGRELLESLPQGETVKVVTISMQTNSSSSFASCDCTAAWATFLNRQVSAAVRGDASELPETVQTLVENEHRHFRS